MTTPTYPDQKPGLITAIAVMTLASGVVNLFWGFVASATALGTLIGIFCLPITILPTILGIFEIIYAAKLLSTQPQPVKPSQSIAIFEIMCLLLLNIFSMVVGILALVFYNDPVVKDYFARLNGTLPPTPVPPAPMPTPEVLTPVEPVPEPVDPAPLLTEPPSPPETKPAAPEKKKPRIRKVAGK
jgi:hypothetical protein